MIEFTTEISYANANSLRNHPEISKEFCVSIFLCITVTLMRLNPRRFHRQHKRIQAISHNLGIERHCDQVLVQF